MADQRRIAGLSVRQLIYDLLAFFGATVVLLFFVESFVLAAALAFVLSLLVSRVPREL